MRTATGAEETTPGPPKRKNIDNNNVKLICTCTHAVLSKDFSPPLGASYGDLGGLLGGLGAILRRLDRS